MSALSIGKVAKRAGIGVETVRFYERRGLLEEPTRTASGYRQYDIEDIARLAFIQQASLEELQSRQSRSVPFHC